MTDAVQEVVQALEFPVPTANTSVQDDSAIQEEAFQVHENETGRGEYTTENPYQTILSNMLVKLEGIAHMSKPEIIAIVDEARSSFEKL